MALHAARRVQVFSGFSQKVAPRACLSVATHALIDMFREVPQRAAISRAIRETTASQ
jgi:hypothetical protein